MPTIGFTWAKHFERCDSWSDHHLTPRTYTVRCSFLLVQPCQCSGCCCRNSRVLRPDSRPLSSCLSTVDFFLHLVFTTKTPCACMDGDIDTYATHAMRLIFFTSCPRGGRFHSPPLPCWHLCKRTTVCFQLELRMVGFRSPCVSLRYYLWELPSRSDECPYREWTPLIG